MTLKINSTHPEVIRNEDATLVGVAVEEYYACTCYNYQPTPVHNDPCPCLNGGVCNDPANPTACTCPDSINYGPNCELLTARFNSVDGYAWFQPMDTCEQSTLSVSFETDFSLDGVLIYNGPIVRRPFKEYPKDFVYLYIKSRKVVAYVELGTGTMVLSVPIDQSVEIDTMTAFLSWDRQSVGLKVENCMGSNSTGPLPAICISSVNLIGTSPSFLFNSGSPLQLGGTSPMPSFSSLATSYGWSQLPEETDGFRGCVKKVQFNDHIYDMNSTDYFSEGYYHRTCDNIIVGAIVKLGSESIAIIVTSLFILLSKSTSASFIQPLAFNIKK